MLPDVAILNAVALRVTARRLAEAAQAAQHATAAARHAARLAHGRAQALQHRILARRRA